MRIAAHQPHSFPWLGYLHKLALCDAFVIMDDVQFEARNFQNRNRVKTNTGATWLTIPLVHGSQRDRICDKLIAECTSVKEDWRRRIWLTLKLHYGNAPYFAPYSDALEDAFARPWERLLDFDLHMLSLFKRWFGIDTETILSSSLRLQGQKTERLVDMCARVGASSYYTGKGGSTEYLDIAAFERIGVGVEWQEFQHPVYPQRYPSLGFVKNLAAFDLLFNCGPESRKILLEGQPSTPNTESLGVK